MATSMLTSLEFVFASEYSHLAPVIIHLPKGQCPLICQRYYLIIERYHLTDHHFHLTSSGSLVPLPPHQSQSCQSELSPCWLITD